MIKLTVFLLLSSLIKANMVPSYSPNENIFNIEQDVAIEIADDYGIVHYMEVFKSNLNDRIILEKNQEEYSKLKWYSLGIPTLVENKLLNKSIINLNSNGFHIYVQMLTNQNRNKIIDAIRNKYNIDVKYYQIDNIIANEYRCYLELNCKSDNNVKFFGSVNDFLKFPLRVDFKIDNNNKHKDCLVDKLTNYDENNELIFHCTLTTVSKNEKINFLKIDSSIYEKMNIEDDLFGKSESIYLTRAQLGNLASTLHFSLDVWEEYQIDKHEFSQEFLENFISQITKKSFERIPIKEALSYLSKYSTRDFEPDILSNKLNNLLKIEKIGPVNYISINQDSQGYLFEPLDINSTLNIVKKKENFWKSSEKNLNEQINELNKETSNDIEWGFDYEKIVPKSLKVSKLVRNQFKKTISFNRIFKKEFEKTFVRSFDLYNNIKRVEISLTNEELIEKKFEFVYKNVSNLMEKFEKRLNKKVLDLFDKITWNINYGPVKKKLTIGHTNDVETFALLSNGDLASGSDDMTILIWDLNDGVIKRRLTGHTDKVRSLILGPDGDLVSASFDFSIIIWDKNDGSIKQKLTVHRDKVRTLIIIKDGDLASGSDDKTIILWNSKDWSIRKKLVGHTDAIYALLALGTGDLASGSKDGSIFIWNTTEGKIKKKLPIFHKDMIRGLALSSDHNEMISGSEDSTVLIWDLNDYSVKKKLKFEKLRSLVILPNGHLAIGTYNKSILIVNYYNEGLPVRKLVEHNGCVNRMILLPNGDLISGSDDKTIIIWNLVYNF